MSAAFQVLHYNVGRQKQVQWSVLNNAAYSKFTVLALVEPYLFRRPDTGEGYCGFHERWRPVIPTVQREHTSTQFAYRAILWVNAAVEAVQVPIDSCDLVAATLQTAEATVLVISAYDPNDRSRFRAQDPDLYEKLTRIRKAIDDTRARIGGEIEVVMCSDLNRYDCLWGGRDGVRRARRDEGRPLVHLAHEFDLQSMLPTGTITWQHPGREQSSTVDVIMASRALVPQLVRCHIHEHDHGSDHRPVAIEFRLRPQQVPTKLTRFIPEKADWLQIGNEVLERLRHVPRPENPNTVHLDAIAEGFMEAVVQTVHASVPRARPSPYAKRWWTPDLTLLRTPLSSARNLVTTLRRRGEDAFEARERYRVARQEYFRRIERQKSQHWKEFLAEPNNLWRANQYTSIASGLSHIPTLRYEDAVAETEEAKAALLMANFFPAPPEPESNTGHQQARERRRGRVPRDLPAITTEEIDQAIFRYNPRKAPGADEISFEMWRQLLPSVRPWIQWIYQTSLDLAYVPRSWRHAKIIALRKPGKADYTVPKAYRPISLLPTISKGLECIVATRLSYLAERYSLLPDNHFGARKQRSSEQALDILVEKISEAWRGNRVLSLVTLDVQGAFNGVHPAILERRLGERGVPSKIVRWIRSFCEDRTGTVVMGRHVSECVRIAHAGIPQGSPLSPILYVFYNANLVESRIDAEGGSLGFIDNYTAWRTGADCDETMRKLRLQVLLPAARWARESGATFEAAKTSLIHFERPRVEPCRKTSLRFLGQGIEPQDRIKVLGVILDSKLQMTDHIDKIVERATKRCLAMGRLRGIRPRQVRQMYQVAVTATTDYAASTWYAEGRRGTQEHVARLGRVQRMGAQAVIGAFRTVSSAVLQDEAGLEPVAMRLAKRVAKHALEVRALPRGHPLCTIMNGMERRSNRHASPLFETWSRYHKALQGTKGAAITARPLYALAPWHDHQQMVFVHEAAEAMRFHREISASIAKNIVYYTDASVRNGWAGVAVVRYDPSCGHPGFKVVCRETIGREKTCTATAAEVWAIKTALERLGRARESGWIVTDSQEALHQIENGARSRKLEALVSATLREVQSIKDQGQEVKFLWVPGHKGIPGNERAHVAAQTTTAEKHMAMVKPEQRIREQGEVQKLLRKAMDADRFHVQGKWGKYTYAIDSALPGKHTLQLYGPLSHEDAGILAQARTGHAHLNEYMARIRQIESPMCMCGQGGETVKHGILHCPNWTAERTRLKEVAGDRWGDVSYLLGGKSRRRDPRTGQYVDGDQWRPDLVVVRATIAFLKSTGRFSSQVIGADRR
ncbi:hypothetical protein CKM354_000785200 [Cercospora kikuchii]|uniref:Reverse transcriptase n=1 Tax=Cercospora kikuchii TaxID=84275 RepID=A0A9P3FJC6_9PEZI|nr:uncharacterized protein CKM354_000784600 [Cercospora kikuchii]XP_044659148.1 uncharacterized protein CKM354_000785200 [Cercospora kikuchii]GIZ44655.1 hypothetical protein CKM354_000784600 [Cercospora kikuchii]GIZ44661.1 hypothetical protein CKM354_000785200 [Cercospora kikuchii]